MANYWSAPTYIPTQIWTPDWESINANLALRQQKYNVGAEQLSTLRNSFFNKEVTKQANVEAKEQYIKEAEQKIKNLSTVDLSLQENMREATTIFQPFIEDKDLQMDMLYTQSQNRELMKAYALKDSSDEDERKGYDQRSVEYIMNGIEKVRNAKKGDTDVYSTYNRKYIRGYDITSELNKKIKEVGGKIIHSSNGTPGYIEVTTNGERSRIIYDQWANETLRNDPRFREFANVVGVVDYEKRVKDKTIELSSKGLPVNEEIISKEIGLEIYEGNLKAIKDKIVKVEEVKQKYLDEIEAMGKIGDSEEDMEKKARYEELTRLVKAYDNTKKTYDEQYQKYADPNNKEDSINNISTNKENYFAEKYLSTAASNWANTYSNVTSEYKVEKDNAYYENLKLQQDESQFIRQQELDLKKHTDNLTMKEKELSAKRGSGSTEGGESGGEGGGYVVTGSDPKDINTQNAYISKVNEIDQISSEGFSRVSQGLVSMYSNNPISNSQGKIDMTDTNHIPTIFNKMNQGGWNALNNPERKIVKVMVADVRQKLKDAGVDPSIVSFNNPQSIANGYEIALSKQLANKNISPEVRNNVAAALTQISSGTADLQTANDERVKLSESVDKIIQSKEYDSVTVTDKNGKKRLMNEDDVIKKYNIGVIYEKVDGKYLPITPKETARAILNGKFSITAGGKFRIGDRLGTDKIPVVGAGTFGLVDGYWFNPNATKLFKNSSELKKLGSKLQEATNQVAQSGEISSMGKTLSYETGTTEKTRNSYGNQILHAAKTNVDGVLQVGKGVGLMEKKDSKRLTDILSLVDPSMLDTRGVNYYPTGSKGSSISLNFTAKGLKELKESLTDNGIDYNDDDLKDLQNGNIRFLVNKTDGVLSKLPTAGDSGHPTLDRGESITAPPHWRDNGFDMTVTPDRRDGNYRYMTVQMKVQVQDPDDPKKLIWTSRNFTVDRNEKTPKEVLESLRVSYGEYLNDKVNYLNKLDVEAKAKSKNIIDTKEFVKQYR